MVIKVLLADDHAVVRDGIQLLLEQHEDIRVVGAAANTEEALRLAAAVSPDVGIFDIAMPGRSGIEATRELRSTLPHAAVIILSMYSSPELVREALRAGARGYLRKEEAGEELVKAVRAVAAGGSFLGVGIADLLIEGCRDEERTPIFALTVRERELLRLVIDGKTNSEAAAVLGLSPRSVETYRLRLMRKLRIKDLPSLVKYAIRSGLTTLD